MLSNAYFLAKFRFDTAENEPAKNLQNFANFPDCGPLKRGSSSARGAHGAVLGLAGSLDLEVSPRGRGLLLPPPRTRRVVANFWQIFGKMLLVFGCIGADFCK